MGLKVKHATQANGADSGSGEIHKSEWNEEHALDGTLSINNGGTGASTASAAANALDGFLEIVASITPVTLEAASPRTVFVSGTGPQTIVLPPAGEITEGWTYTIINGSSADVTAQAVGVGSFTPQKAGITATYTCVLIDGVGASHWVQRFSSDTPVGEVSLDGGSF